MKTPDEIKKGLVYCMSRDCAGGKCPYYHAKSCNAEKSNDVLAYIQQLEAERDAAVECINRECDNCKYCDQYYGEEPCLTSEELESLDSCPNWQWRGVQKEE